MTCAILNFVPVKTVDELVAPGGGNPKAQPLAARHCHSRHLSLSPSLRPILRLNRSHSLSGSRRKSVSLTRRKT